MYMMAQRRIATPLTPPGNPGHWTAMSHTLSTYAISSQIRVAEDHHRQRTHGCHCQLSHPAARL
jgi:hypothetical protein